MSATMSPRSRPAFPSRGKASNLKSVKHQPPVQILKRPADLPKNQAPADVQKVIPKAKPSLPTKSPPSNQTNIPLALPSEPVSTSPPKPSTKRNPRGRQRSNSITTSSLPSTPPDSQPKGGNLSDGPVSAKGSSSQYPPKLRRLPSNSVPTSRVLSCPSKEQAAELLLQSLLQGKFEPQTPKSTSLPEGPEPVMNDLVMSSHLLLNLLKPTKLPSSPSLPPVSKSGSYYAGPMFRKAPNPSSLPLPSFLAE